MTIVNRDIDNVLKEENQKLLEYYLTEKERTYGNQFRQAFTLAPTVNEDDLVVSNPSLYDAFSHFASMFWKILFATVPPP